jgi:hypothetical protein
MRLLGIIISILAVVSANAQSFGFSVYTSTGIISYSKPVYERMGTTPTGQNWEAGVSLNRIHANDNISKIYVGLHHENMAPFKIDLSSAGATHIQNETDERALYLRFAFIHEHNLNGRIFIPVKFNGNSLLKQKHTGYTHYTIPGNPEEYEYFTNTKDVNRRSASLSVISGLGFRLPAGLQAELLLEAGTSPHAKYKRYFGASVGLSWNFEKL